VQIEVFLEFRLQLRIRIEAGNITIIRLSEMTKIHRNRLSQIIRDGVRPSTEEAATLAHCLEGPAELLRSYCRTCPVRNELKSLLREHGIDFADNIDRLLNMVREIEADYDSKIKTLWDERPAEDHPSYYEYMELIKKTWGRKNDLNQAALMYFTRS
jgi:hypothetical protein